MNSYCELKLNARLDLLKEKDDNHENTQYLQGLFQGYIDSLFDLKEITVSEHIQLENKLTYIVFDRHFEEVK